MGGRQRTTLFMDVDKKQGGEEEKSGGKKGKK